MAHLRFFCNSSPLSPINQLLSKRGIDVKALSWPSLLGAPPQPRRTLYRAWHIAGALAVLIALNGTQDIQRLKMVFGMCCQRERLYKFLSIVQIFILAGMVYYYFQGKTAPNHEIAEGLSQPIGETLRPVWGPMDKCYPVTIQRRRVKSRNKEVSKAMALKVMGGLNDAAPKEETDILSQDGGEGRSSGEEAASPIPAGKEMAEEKKVAGTPGCEGNKKVQKETATYPSEASEVKSKEERPRGWVRQLLRKLWLSWSPASDNPETRNHE